MFDLQPRWQALAAHFEVGPSQAEEAYQILARAYSEPGRYYHTLTHLAQVLKVIEELGELTRDLQAVELAGWFHDAVYDSRAKDNEEQSAALARQTLVSWSLEPARLEKVISLVMATKSHRAEPNDPDAQVLLDADLSILGADEPTYRRYAASIRQEYGWVEETAYRIGRLAVLQNFLNRPVLFFTESARQKWEEAAWRNLQAEIALLETGEV